jgi:hypothetical protein
VGVAGAAPIDGVEPSDSSSLESSITTYGADGTEWVESLARDSSMATSSTLASPPRIIRARSTGIITDGNDTAGLGLQRCGHR